MKRFKETDKSKNEVRTVEKPGAVGGSLLKSTSSVACLVCHGPFKTTSNSLIPNLPFCKKCKSTYFNLMADKSRPENLLSSQQLKCPTGGQCTIDYRYSSPEEWCSSCHVRKFQAILRRFDTFKVNSNCDQHVNEPHPDPPAQGNPDLNPMVLVEKLTSHDLASFGIEAPELSRSDKHVIGESENHVLLPSKSSSDVLRPHRSFPLTKQVKRRKKLASWRKTSRVTNPFMKSIDIYVFDCGHACKVCNSSQSKEWLKDCGFHTASPLIAEEVIHPTVNHSTNSLPLSAEDSHWSSSLNGSTLSGHQPEMTRPETTTEPHTQPHTLHSCDNGDIILQSSQAGGPPFQLLCPVLLPVGFAPQMANGVLVCGTIPGAVQSLKVNTASSSQ